MKMVLVEDDDAQITQYTEVLEDYIERLSRPIKMCVCRTVDEARERVDSSVDAIVMDLNLGRDTHDGTEVIAELKDHFRVPVAVLTGTPSDADNDPPVVRVFTKGEHGFEDVLDCLWDIYSIGLTRIMGGRGLLEKQLNSVFQNNLLPSLDVWVGYGADDPERTEKALLRFALGHLVAELEGDETPCFPEESYLAPPLKRSLTTGTLLRRTEDETCHVVMTPACDLVVRDGRCKAEWVVVAEVVSEGGVFGDLKGNAKDRKKKQDRLRSNSEAFYYHWLPKSALVEGGFLDFRQIQTIPRDRVTCEFEDLGARIAPSFIKDIVSRFSAFYARQGQPVIQLSAAST